MRGHLQGLLLALLVVQLVLFVPARTGVSNETESALPRSRSPNKEGQPTQRAWRQAAFDLRQFLEGSRERSELVTCSTRQQWQLPTPALEERMKTYANEMRASCERRTEKGKVLVYVLYYDESSHAEALTGYSQYPWARFLKVGSDEIFENQAYLMPEHENNRADRERLMDYFSEWCDAEFVGLIAYKAAEKVGHQVAQEIDKITLRATKSSGSQDAHSVEFVALYQPRWNVPLMMDGLCFHGLHFRHAYCDLLTSVGFSERQIEDSFAIRYAASNYWLTTPTLMLHYVQFMSMLVGKIHNDTRIQMALDHDARYGVKKASRKATAERVFHTHYYKLHPFVLERMPSFFFWSQNVSAYYLTAARCGMRAGHEIDGLGPPNPPLKWCWPHGVQKKSPVCHPCKALLRYCPESVPELVGAKL
mmetsp:Transcript_300/g.997  ORF Transcript_300/g.997 Transcript_300/m.997 type:complete len:420 (-) Transcript_300:218-1477(-)